MNERSFIYQIMTWDVKKNIDCNDVIENYKLNQYDKNENNVRDSWRPAGGEGVFKDE